ncbi:MAG: STAS/SEC14 domain-containing protein [Rhodospirillaceae bacterium]|nr:STAS/SEC14 domain-containing protein [Rhodospirillaceae bacterium]
MIELLPESHDKVVGFRASGRLTDADYKQVLIPALEALLARHGKLDVLFLLDERFAGWDLTAAWDDARFGMAHRTDFERLAVVGGPDWLHRCIALAGFLMKGEIKVFPADRLGDAWAWVKG